MKIAYLLEFPTLLGGERSWLALLPHLSEVHPLAVARPEGPLARRLRAEGVGLLPFSWPSGDPETRAAKLVPLLKEVSPDLLHANSLTTSLCAAGAAEALGCPAVGHVRDIMRLSRARVQRLNRLNAIVCVSEAAAGALREQGVRSEVLRVQHNGIDAGAAFHPEKVPDRLHETSGIPPGAPVVGFVGQLVLRKDPLTFLRAVALVQDRKPEVRAVLLGARHSEKEEAVAYEARLREEAPEGVLFLGEVPDPRTLLRGMAAVVNTSQQDPLSRVILEALALARPVVATDVGGTRELISDERTGLLVPAGDPGCCAEAILRILDSPALARRLGETGRKEILEEFTPESAARGILRVYREVIEGRGA
jgi:glycosyltransferase involved in cell wall biosynthesis